MNNNNEPSYGMTETAKLLGITRQAAYVRLHREGWGKQSALSGKQNQIMIPSSVIKESRDRERRALWNRLNELDALEKKQVTTESIKTGD